MTPARPNAAALALGALACLGACAHASGGPPGRLDKDVAFGASSPLVRSDELLRRVLTPLGFREARRAMAARSKELEAQPVDLARERFTVYVPAGAPPAAGWGLLVFVSPGKEAIEPRRWRAALDRHGVVLVSAANAGNESPLYERRLPLAVLAAENVRARHPIDPARVYVGGLSGGSRVAEVAALAYPDVFRGALLQAGSEPVGGARGLRLPPADLFRRFQETRIVFATGGADEGALQYDLVSQGALREWCVLDQRILTPPRLGHEALDATSLDHALALLERPPAVDAARRERCDAEVERAVSTRAAAVEAALARGDREGARALLAALDLEYSGVAAAVTLALDARLEAAR